VGWNGSSLEKNHDKILSQKFDSKISKMSHLEFIQSGLKDGHLVMMVMIQDIRLWRDVTNP
jgi:hypothetical protein